MNIEIDIAIFEKPMLILPISIYYSNILICIPDKDHHYDHHDDHHDDDHEGSDSWSKLYPDEVVFLFFLSYFQFYRITRLNSGKLQNFHFKPKLSFSRNNHKNNY